MYQATTLSMSILSIDADGPFICLIQARVEELMHVQTLVIPGATPRLLLSQGALPRQHPPQITMSPSSHL